MYSESLAEINLASKLINAKKLFPPIDIFSLANKYAKVDVMDIPFDVDGISLNLKDFSKKPHIIINDKHSEHRTRFTLAHELGHVLIPWHIGSRIDYITLPNGDEYDEFWQIEAEANRFASELLMPSKWVRDIITNKNYDLIYITNELVERANVSSHAATLKIKDNLKPGYVFAALNDEDEVIFSGRSKGTFSIAPSWNIKIKPDKYYPNSREYIEVNINGFKYYWWVFDSKVPIADSAIILNWKELLDEMINDIGIPSSRQKFYKQSLNGVIAAANGDIKGKRSVEILHSAILQRIHNHGEFEDLVNHPDFPSFILSRIDGFMKN